MKLGGGHPGLLKTIRAETELCSTGTSDSGLDPEVH
jgi:hypothetical protein